MSRFCPIDSCNKRTHFGLLGEKTSRCSTHATSDMVRIYPNKNICAYDGCKSISPSFGLIGEKERFCKKHSTKDMINLKHKTCEIEGCTVINPIFDIPGGIGKFCFVHKTSDMIDVKHPICKYDGCKTRPIFGKPGCKPEYCKDHKSKDMCDITTKKRCEQVGCNIVASFDFKNGKGRFCKRHQLDGMINITARLCLYEECKIVSSFGKPGDKPQYCKKHSTKDMVDCINKRCVFEGCKIINPAYNNIGEKGKYCKLHSEDSMVDVHNPMCNMCTKRAIYGISGNKPSSCFTHRKPGMIKRPNKKCKVCSKQAVYGVNYMALHCEEHKLEHEQNLIERECISCHLVMVLDKDNKCEYCNPIVFNSVRLAKQNALLNYLDSRKLNGTSTDKIIDRGVCGKERPDRVFELTDRVIIIECDENQHKDRNCSCEQTRMINIGNLFGGLPVYFIRWNPDDYVPESEKSMPEKINKRYKLLGDFLSDIINNNILLPYAFISAFYMYYDGWNCLATEKWNILAKYE